MGWTSIRELKSEFRAETKKHRPKWLHWAWRNRRSLGSVPIDESRRAEIDSILQEVEHPVRVFLSRRLQDSHGVEDILQETFLRIAFNIDRYPTISNPIRFAIRIARNLLVDRFRVLARWGGSTNERYLVLRPSIKPLTDILDPL